MKFTVALTFVGIVSFANAGCAEDADDTCRDKWFSGEIDLRDKDACEQRLTKECNERIA